MPEQSEQDCRHSTTGSRSAETLLQSSAGLRDNCKTVLTGAAETEIGIKRPFTTALAQSSFPSCGVHLKLSVQLTLHVQ